VRTPALILAAFLTASCSSGGAQTSPSSSTAPTPTSLATASADRCQEVAQEDQRVTDTLIDKGCTDDKGSLRFGKVTPCKDGRRLWEMGDLIGFSGELIFSQETKAEGGVPVSTLYHRACKG
jgi:hypothetical protein